jgi:DeoR/GlpR family transcriptional regulator of sugar metabolism
MKPHIRQQRILERLRAIQKEWKVDELSAAMKVSPITIRRDLESLGRQGALIRTFGGGLIDNRRKLAAYHERVAKNFELKQTIGRAAAKEIRNGAVILINDGSTTFHLAGRLGDCGKITVYTNSVVMIGEISSFSNVRLNIIGGEYHPDYFYLGGSLLERVLETISADIAFIGTDAISPDGGCYCQDEDTSRVARMMMKQARRAILLADHTKVGAESSVRFAKLGDFALWITSKGLKINVLNKLRKMTKIMGVGR